MIIWKARHGSSEMIESFNTSDFKKSAYALQTMKYDCIKVTLSQELLGLWTRTGDQFPKDCVLYVDTKFLPAIKQTLQSDLKQDPRGTSCNHISNKSNNLFTLSSLSCYRNGGCNIR